MGELPSDGLRTVSRAQRCGSVLRWSARTESAAAKSSKTAVFDSRIVGVDLAAKLTVNGPDQR